MIVPEGTKLLLDPKDEYNHTPEPAANYNESMYFNGFDIEKGLGLWVRIGNRPNEGHAEVTCCIYLPDGRAAFIYAKPTIDNNDTLSAAGMTFEVIEPFKQLKVRYSGKVLLLDNPHDMAEPGMAFKKYPKVPCEIDLDVYGISPMHGGEIINLDGTPWELDPETAVFRGHTEQHTRMEGRIEVGETAYTLAGLGVRDKSWGPRFWQNFYWYRWIPVTFGPDFGIILALMGQRDGPPVVSGHIFRDGVLHPLLDASVETQWDENHYQRALTVRLKTQSEELVLHGTVPTLVPLRNRRTQKDGSEVTARIAEGMTRYECDGRIGLGMSEFLDVVEDGVPIAAT